MIFRIILFSAVIFCSFSYNSNAQPVIQNKINPELIDNHWHAYWITHPAESILDYGVFHFRKDFELKTIPPEFIIHISADNRYRLFVNGTAVCFGPSRSDLAHWSYESIDIAPFLKPGKNLLAAEVWNFGALKPWAQFSLKTALIVQGNSIVEEIVNTNEAWKVIKNYAYSPAAAGSSETSGQFVVVGPCDRVEAGKYPWGWEIKGFDDSNWLTAEKIDIGHPRGLGTDINWVLTPRRIPMMEQAYQRLAVVRRSSGGNVPAGFISCKKGPLGEPLLVQP